MDGQLIVIDFVSSLLGTGILVLLLAGLFHLAWRRTRGRFWDAAYTARLTKIIVAWALLSTAASAFLRSEADQNPDDRQATDDRQAMTRFDDLYKTSQQQSWGLITPIKKFEAGQIGPEALLKDTALAEMELTRAYTEMMRACQTLRASSQTSCVEFSGALMLRHKGLLMIRDGYVREDHSMVQRGTELFEEQRRRVISLAAQAGAASDPSGPESEVLRRLEGADRSR